MQRNQRGHHQKRTVNGHSTQPPVQTRLRGAQRSAPPDRKPEPSAPDDERRERPLPPDEDQRTSVDAVSRFEPDDRPSHHHADGSSYGAGGATGSWNPEADTERYPAEGEFRRGSIGDWNGARAHGSAPKGHTRNDERLKEDISERIAHLAHVEASDVEVSVEDGSVTISGTVPDRQMRWDLEQLLDHVHGVKDVVNNLKVKREH